MLHIFPSRAFVPQAKATLIDSEGSALKHEQLIYPQISVQL
jgi:hypothetical protein